MRWSSPTVRLTSREPVSTPRQFVEAPRETREHRVVADTPASLPLGHRLLPGRSSEIPLSVNWRGASEHESVRKADSGSRSDPGAGFGRIDRVDSFRMRRHPGVNVLSDRVQPGCGGLTHGISTAIQHRIQDHDSSKAVPQIEIYRVPFFCKKPEIFPDG